MTVLDLRLLSDEELCQAWCAGYDGVITARSARGLGLAGAATADRDPTPYLRRGFDAHQEDR